MSVGITRLKKMRCVVTIQCNFLKPLKRVSTSFRYLTNQNNLSLQQGKIIFRCNGPKVSITEQKLHFQRPWMLKKREVMYYITKTTLSLSLSLSLCTRFFITKIENLITKLSVKGYPSSEKTDNILQKVIITKVVFINECMH